VAEIKRLARCPFCNSEDIELHTIEQKLAMHVSEYSYVHCRNCGAEVSFTDNCTKQDTVQRWNRRALNLCN
jgi:Lar family restriction alleviation protein